MDNGLDNTCEVIIQETVLFSTPGTDYIIYDYMGWRASTGVLPLLAAPCVLLGNKGAVVNFVWSSAKLIAVQPNYGFRVFFVN